MELVTKNIGWKLLALLIAVLLWAAVANEPELSTFVSVPVEYQDMPGNLDISSEVVEHVTLELRGPAGELRSFSAGKTAVVLDMSNVQPGQRTFTIGTDNVQLPSRLRLIRAIPSQLRFRFEKRIERTVPVEARFSGSPPTGYAVAKQEVAPPSLTIEGPESRVKQVQSAITDAINLSALTGTGEFHVNTFVDDSHVRIVSGSEVTVNVWVERK